MKWRRAAIIGIGVLGLGCGAIGAALSLGLFEPPGSGAAAALSAKDSAARPVDDAPAERVAPAAANSAPRADPVWIAATATATGIPERALTAYAQAALLGEEEAPGCGIGWNTIAAIGLVESAHGTINGAKLGANGRAVPEIVGPALDGTVYDAIPDTDRGVLDGDPMWDRAVGPLQFLPQTWSDYGKDATGDGTADPHQIDDAAWGTATMLCAVGGDLTIPENWIAAVDAYNPNIAYNNDVADAADAYAAAASSSAAAR
ncbi:hypothetical protein EDF60_2696 [Leucobacter luti]|uniref:hypothetical protein n=1 Tax=Leucobacter luti TaxID=340320 RepID=UPI0010D02CD8|nr:hypothetical protein [Leucobacter luti]MCW2289819.1 membrane-bound lytic murein transglycosylase B [Leucobacter luti]TCK35988.1 hypothetical protein EDF60_2696 [Leucobacter luti]